MAPIAPTKRRSLRAKLAAKSGSEPYAPRKAPRPDAVAPVSDGFASTKEDKRLMRRSRFLSRVEETSSSSARKNNRVLKRRRPGRKLVTNLQSLADALPELELENDAEVEGKLGKVRHNSVKMKKGALKKKEGIVRSEVERFGKNMAQLTAVGAAEQKQQQQQQQQQLMEEDDQAQNTAPVPTPTANRWAALRGFISQTMEQNPAFVGKKS